MVASVGRVDILCDLTVVEAPTPSIPDPARPDPAALKLGPRIPILGEVPPGIHPAYSNRFGAGG
jgi:hypothetical protein